MSTMVSPGVYPRLVDRSHVVSSGGLIAGGIVIAAKRGPAKINVVTSATEFLETYGDPTRDNPGLHCGLRFLQRAGILTVRRVVVDAVKAAGVITKEITEEVPNPEYDADTNPSVPETITVTDEVEHLAITAQNEGAWGNKVRVTIAELDEAPEGVFAVLVFEKQKDGEFEVVEQFEVSRDPEAKNGYGNTVFIEDVINKRSKFIRVKDSPDVEDAYPFGDIDLTGGKDDTIAPSAGAIVSAWEEFENAESVPAQLLINAGWAVPAVQNKMLMVAETRRDAVAILDIPEDVNDDAQAMIAYRKTELMANTYWGGIFGGWLKIYDQFSDTEMELPPSGDVAATFVRTAEQAERWDAPAGLQRGIIPNTLGVTKVFSQGERDLLALAQINPVTSLGGAGSVIWGQSTLQVQMSALSRFNVVNSLIYIQGAMALSLEPFVFQNNTEDTRDSINFLLSSFLENIQLRGGLYDFYVDTGTEINSPQVIDNNELHVDVYVQPVRAAEKIRLSTIVTRTGVKLG